jgi:hypothetical protein
MHTFIPCAIKTSLAAILARFPEPSSFLFLPQFRVHYSLASWIVQQHTPISSLMNHTAPYLNRFNSTDQL